MSDPLRDSTLARDLQAPISAYNEDYHIFQTTKEEDVMRAVRNGLYGAGIPVENAPRARPRPGQEEVNSATPTRSTPPTTTRSSRTAIKEIAWTKGRSVTFMAKYDHRRAGSSSPCPPVALDAGRQARLPRRQGPARHVRR